MGCPNCGADAEGDALLCPSCGFDLHTRAADEVRRLREAGRIKAGRLHPHESSVAPVAADAGEPAQGGRSEHFDAGL